MKRPEMKAVDGGFEYIMLLALSNDFNLATAQGRARQSESNGYQITVEQVAHRDPGTYAKVTIKGNQAPWLSREVAVGNLPAEPYTRSLRHITSRVEWVCGHWQFPPDTLGS